MNKKLLAIAVGAAMVAGSTAAMAEATLYGKIHVSIDSLDNGSSVATTDNDPAQDGIFISSNSSRLGIKGSEDLDGGLKVVYKYEMQSDYNDAVIAGSRNRYVGLSGGFGTVLVGAHDTPFKTIGRKHDLFGDTIADARNLTNDGSNDDRLSDLILYKNKFGAIGFAVSYQVEDSTVGSGGSSLGVTFKQGPLSLAAATANLSGGNFGATAEDQTGISVVGKYKFGPATVGVRYQDDTNKGGLDGADGTVTGVSASMKSGMNTFKINYLTRDNESATDDDTGTLIALGVDHKMSKMTKVYAMYATMDNDDTANFGLGGSGHDGDKPGATTGESYTGLSVGIVKKF
jgi:predicted porin